MCAIGRLQILHALPMAGPRRQALVSRAPEISHHDSCVVSTLMSVYHSYLWNRRQVCTRSHWQHTQDSPNRLQSLMANVWIMLSNRPAARRGSVLAPAPVSAAAELCSLTAIAVDSVMTMSLATCGSLRTHIMTWTWLAACCPCLPLDALIWPSMQKACAGCC